MTENLRQNPDKSDVTSSDKSSEIAKRAKREEMVGKYPLKKVKHFFPAVIDRKGPISSHYLLEPSVRQSLVVPAREALHEVIQLVNLSASLEDLPISRGIQVLGAVIYNNRVIEINGEPGLFIRDRDDSEMIFNNAGQLSNVSWHVLEGLNKLPEQIRDRIMLIDIADEILLKEAAKIIAEKKQNPRI